MVHIKGNNNSYFILHILDIKVHQHFHRLCKWLSWFSSTYDRQKSVGYKLDKPFKINGIQQFKINKINFQNKWHNANFAIASISMFSNKNFPSQVE